jgi:2-dehydropantoate 2-reductase
MRIGIVGAGGVGGLLGGLLARAGAEVALVARGEHLRAIRERGLRVETPKGSFEVKVEASDDPARLRPADAVLVAVKTWQLQEVAPKLAPLFGPGAVAVPLLNGIGASDVLARALGNERVCGGVCHVFAWIAGPGVVEMAGGPPRVAMGELDGGGRRRLEELSAAMRAAGIDSSVVDDVRVALWEKLLFVGPLGAVGAAARSPAGVVRTTPETRALLERAMREIGAVARARGAAVADSAVASALARVDSLPPDSTTSLHRDLVAGRPSELADLVGAVVRAAAETGTPAPAHDFLWATLLPQENAARAGSRNTTGP